MSDNDTAPRNEMPGTTEMILSYATVEQIMQDWVNTNLPGRYGVTNFDSTQYGKFKLIIEEIEPTPNESADND